MSHLKVIAIILSLTMGFSPAILAASTKPMAPAKETSPEQPLDRTVAIVGDQIITESELAKSIEVAKKQYGQYSNTLSEQELKKQVLDGLVNRKLLLVYAKQQGININDKQIDAAIEQNAAANHLTVSDLKEEVTKAHITYEAYRERVQEELTIQSLMQNVASNIKVTPADIAAFREKYQAQLPTQYHLEAIRIPLSSDENDTPSPSDIQAARKKAMQLVKQLRGGLSFEKAMKDYPHYPSADLGWRPAADIPDLFLKTLPQLKVNGISDPIQADNGFHIIKLLGKRESVAQQQMEYQVKLEKAQQEVEKQLKKFRSQVFIKVSP